MALPGRLIGPNLPDLLQSEAEHPGRARGCRLIAEVAPSSPGDNKPAGFKQRSCVLEHHVEGRHGAGCGEGKFSLLSGFRSGADDLDVSEGTGVRGAGHEFTLPGHALQQDEVGLWPRDGERKSRYSRTRAEIHHRPRGSQRLELKRNERVR